MVGSKAVADGGLEDFFWAEAAGFARSGIGRLRKALGTLTEGRELKAMGGSDTGSSGLGGADAASKVFRSTKGACDRAAAAVL